MARNYATLRHNDLLPCLSNVLAKLKSGSKMDFFALNRIAGAVFGVAVFVMVARIGAESLFAVDPPELPGYIVDIVDETAEEPEPSAAPPSAMPDFAAAIPAANIENGESVAAPCAICHNWEDGGGHTIGPNLFEIVGRAKSGAAAFDRYSPGFQALDGDWSYADLFAFLEQPATFAPGTTMAFPGVANEQDRLDLLAYMRTWAATPAPLPE